MSQLNLTEFCDNMGDDLPPPPPSPPTMTTPARNINNVDLLTERVDRLIEQRMSARLKLHVDPATANAGASATRPQNLPNALEQAASTDNASANATKELSKVAD